MRVSHLIRWLEEMDSDAEVVVNVLGHEVAISCVTGEVANVQIQLEAEGSRGPACAVHPRGELCPDLCMHPDHN